MLAKLAAAVALIVAVLTAPVIVQPQDETPAGYPAPAQAVGDAPMPPVEATPDSLTPAPCTVWIGAACSQFVTWVPVALAGTPAPCDIWQDQAGVIYCAVNLTPAAPTAPPNPEGYPAP